MVKARSPGYPAIGLREAIEKTRLVYENDYQNKIPRKLVAEHMGYQSLNGKSLGVLSAVAKFGLLAGRGEENWVTDLALAIIAHEPGTPERAQAIAQAASTPELFSDLDARFQSGRVSDGAIRSYLMTQKFIPQAADAVIRAYRETKALVEEEVNRYGGPVLPQQDSEAAPMAAQPHQETSFKVTGVLPLGVPIGERELTRGPLSRDSAYRLLVTGEIGPKEIGKIIKLLTVFKELYSDDQENAEGAPEN